MANNKTLQLKRNGTILDDYAAAKTKLADLSSGNSLADGEEVLIRYYDTTAEKVDGKYPIKTLTGYKQAISGNTDVVVEDDKFEDTFRVTTTAFSGYIRKGEYISAGTSVEKILRKLLSATITPSGSGATKDATTTVFLDKNKYYYGDIVKVTSVKIDGLNDTLTANTVDENLNIEKLTTASTLAQFYTTYESSDINVKRTTASAGEFTDTYDDVSLGVLDSGNTAYTITVSSKTVNNNELSLTIKDSNNVPTAITSTYGEKVSTDTKTAKLSYKIKIGYMTNLNGLPGNMTQDIADSLVSSNTTSNYESVIWNSENTKTLKYGRSDMPLPTGCRQFALVPQIKGFTEIEGQVKNSMGVPIFSSARLTKVDYTVTIDTLTYDVYVGETAIAGDDTSTSDFTFKLK